MIKGGVTCEDRGQKEEKEKEEWWDGGVEKTNVKSSERKQEKTGLYSESEGMDL